MADSYRTLLLTLLPILGCPLPDKADTADTSDSGADTDTDTGTPASVHENGCYAVDPSLTECPAPTDVPPASVTPETCGATVLSVDAAGTLADNCPWMGGFAPTGWCIYPITVLPPDDPCDYGRPLLVAGRPRLAPLTRAPGWARVDRAPTAVAPTPSPTTPTPDPTLAHTWARVALAEHASIASFSRFALDLLALGAPADLVAAAHQAALDEVRHAQLAFAIASTHAGTDGALAPGPLPLADFALSADLAAFARATAAEGCVAETLSALLIAEARDRATDPTIHAALTVMARDEARHAALAWRTLRWATDSGGAPIRAAIAAVLTTMPALPTDEAVGLLPPAVARAALLRGWNEVVAPAAAALLGPAQNEVPVHV